MIPSTLAAEVSGALRGFLSTGFGPSNRALSSVVDEFLARTVNLTKGPYLSVDLPFQQAPEGGEPFPETPLGFTPYRHQRIAFGRLIGGQSTVIATGTGSGKTECFLFPVLDHCRARAGTPGVKAIFIYPMNALASDQARRIAGIVHRTPSLRGKVTAGLYVGETGASPRERMEADHLIENRAVLRERPPDILLTNYKMLDLLLTRPVDFPLWRHNTGGVLRYLVVDELHTFDGAQGTDLACLIRRLRARLQADDGLICAGTSATIGGEEDRAAILDYVSGVFHQRFSPDAVVGEVRQGIDEFLEDAIISSYLVAQPNLADRMDPERYASAGEYIRAQHEVFFGEAPAGDLESAEWRLSLGEKLREHASFVNPPAGAGRLEADPRRRGAGTPATQPAGVRRPGSGALPARPLRADLGGAPAGRLGAGRDDPALVEREAAPLDPRAAPHGVQRARTDGGFPRLGPRRGAAGQRT